MLTCINHGLDITKYCATCQEPICDRCYDMHISHKIVDIDEYYETKFKQLEKIICNELQEKHYFYLQSMRDISYENKQIYQYFRNLSFDCFNEQNKDLYNLQIDIGVFQNELKNLQRYLLQINDLDNSVKTLKNKKIRFVGASSFINEQIQIILKFNPREINKYSIKQNHKYTEDKIEQTKRDGLEKYSKLQNEIINTLIQQIHDEEERKIDDYLKDEILFSQYICQTENDILSDHRLVCSYCGFMVKEDNVNQPCPNKKIQKVKKFLHKDTYYITQKEPDNFDNRRHYFGLAKSNLVPKYRQPSNQIKGFGYYNHYLPQIQFFLKKIQTQSILNNLDFDKLFQKQMKIIPFQYILTEKLKLSQDDCELITIFFEKSGMVDTQKIYKFVRQYDFLDKDQIEAFLKREKMQDDEKQDKSKHNRLFYK